MSPPYSILPASAQVRLSRGGLSPYEITRALCHLLTYHSQRRPDHHGVTVYVGSSGRPTTTGTHSTNAPLIPGLPSSHHQSSSPRGPASPAEGSIATTVPKSPPSLDGGPEADSDPIAIAKVESVKPDNARHDMRIDAPTNTNEPNVTAATTSMTLPSKGAAPSVSASSQRARGTRATVKKEEGSGVANARSGWLSRPAFSGQDWRLLEPELMRFCHKVLHRDGAERAR